ncbi:CatA-like O-acetyltransferase [Pseudochelatococcus sp. B33]
MPDWTVGQCVSVDCPIPNIAVGRFQKAGDTLTFPLAVQVHHGLADGLHIQQLASILAAQRRSGDKLK